MGAQTAGEQAVTVGDLHLVATPAARRADRAGDHVGPGVDVVLRVTNHGRLASGAAGGMQAHDVVHRHGKHAIGVVVAQVVLAGEREPGQVVQRFQVVRVHAQAVEALLVQRHVVVGVVEAPAQALQLVLAQLIDAGGFHRIKRGSVNKHIHGFTRIIFVHWPARRPMSADEQNNLRRLTCQSRSMISAMPWPTPMHMVQSA
ncbi:hypothetical protein D3C78_1320930 [compost metagenome]